MDEIGKLKRARDYIGMMARGRDPITGASVPDDSVLNNIRVCRCLLYVEEVLSRVCEGSPAPARPKAKKEPFSITREQLDLYEYPPYPISVSEVAKRVSQLAPGENMKSLSYRDITNFLLDAGALCEVNTPDGHKHRRPTHFGESLGISVSERQGPNGPYTVVLYNRDAQKFILDNMESILSEDK